MSAHTTSTDLPNALSNTPNMSSKRMEHKDQSIRGCTDGNYTQVNQELGQVSKSHAF